MLGQAEVSEPQDQRGLQELKTSLVYMALSVLKKKILKVCLIHSHILSFRLIERGEGLPFPQTFRIWFFFPSKESLSL